MIGDMPSISYGAAFLAGLLSFFSPCVLPLVPVNLALITGVSVEALMEGHGKRSAFWPTMIRTFLFIAGFSTVFVLLGAGSGAIGGLLREHSRLIEVVGGCVSILFGLHLTGLMKIDFFYRQTGINLTFRHLGEEVATYLMGMTFAVGWQPCVGPILGTILALAATQGGAGKGMGLLLVYSAGLGLPFLLAAAAMGTFLKFSNRVKRVLHLVEIGSGLLLILLGLLLLANKFTLLSQWAAALYRPEIPAGTGGAAPGGAAPVGVLPPSATPVGQ